MSPLRAQKSHLIHKAATTACSDFVQMKTRCSLWAEVAQVHTAWLLGWALQKTSLPLGQLGEAVLQL